MDQNTGNENYFDSTSLIEFFWRWRKPLIIIVVGAAVVSSIVSLTIHDKYKSTVIMFPVASNAVSGALLNEETSDKTDVLQFGEEEQAEQLLQVLNSDEIRSIVCNKFNLADHYHLDPKSKIRNTLLFDMYNDNISFKRTELLSINIDVLDEDPKMASDIANTISDLVDSVKQRVQKDRAQEAFNIVEAAYLAKKADVQRMTDSIHKLNELGMFDYETQSEHVNEQYDIALSKGDQRAIAALDAQKKIIADYGAAYVSMRENLYIQREQLNILKKKYEEAKVDKDKVLPYKFVVDRAFPAERKSYPVRWVIVAVTTISSLIFGVILLILFDNIRNIRRKEKAA